MDTEGEQGPRCRCRRRSLLFARSLCLAVVLSVSVPLYALFDLAEHISFHRGVGPFAFGHWFEVKNVLLRRNSTHFQVAVCEKISRSSCIRPSASFVSKGGLLANSGTPANDGNGDSWRSFLMAQHPYLRGGSLADTATANNHPCGSMWPKGTTIFAPAEANFAHQLLRDAYDLTAISQRLQPASSIPAIILADSGPLGNFTMPLLRSFAPDVRQLNRELGKGGGSTACFPQLLLRNGREWAVPINRKTPHRWAEKTDEVLSHMVALIREHNLDLSIATNMEAYDVLLLKRRSRRIANRGELQVALAQRGMTLKTVFAEDQSLGTMVALVGKARVLVGVHGAGLANLVFLQPKQARVVEVMVAFAPDEPEGTELCNATETLRHRMASLYYNLAKAMGVGYVCYDPPALGVDDLNVKLKPRRRDSAVDVAALADVIERQVRAVS